MTTNGTDLDLLTCDGEALFSWMFADWGGKTFTPRAHQGIAALRDRIVAAVRAQAPTPVAGPELSDSDVAGMIRDRYGLSRSALTDDTILRNRGFQEVALVKDAFARGRASAQAPSLLEAQREAASKALYRVWDELCSLGHDDAAAIVDKHRDRFASAPAGITLSNGDVVRYEREGLRGFHRTGSITVGCNTDPAFYLLNDSDTIGDQKALKAYAAERSEAR